MGKKPKEICEWSKDDIKKHFGRLVEIVSQPDYICKKCGRAASDEHYLCKAKKIIR